MISAATDRGKYLPSAPCANSRCAALTARSAELTAVNAISQPTTHPIEGTPSVSKPARWSRNGTARKPPNCTITPSANSAVRILVDAVATPSATASAAASHSTARGSAGGSA